MDIHGKVALVTGGTRGIGRAITEQLLNNGAKVVMVGTNSEVGEAVAGQLQQQHGKQSVVFMKADVAVQGQLKGVYSETISQFGHVDIVINNAGVYVTNPQVIEINLGGVIHSTTLAVEHMEPENGGRGGVIVNVSSISALPRYGAFSNPIYGATKHAVNGFSKSLAKQLLPSSGIRILVLCPGWVRTDMTTLAQEAEATGKHEAVHRITACGGWTDVTFLANTCMKMIQSEAVTSGTIVKVTGAIAAVVDTEHMPEIDLQNVISTNTNTLQTKCPQEEGKTT